MIVADHDETSKKHMEATSHQQPPPDYAPPAYQSPVEGPSSSASASFPPPFEAAAWPGPPSDLKATNFVHVVKPNSSHKETYVLDPSVPIPQSFLRELPVGEERKNLYCDSKNGSVSVTVWIPPAPEKPNAPITMLVNSHNGSVSVHVRAINPNRPHHAFKLTASSSNGSIQVRIPRTFHGQVELASHNGSLSLTPAVKAVTNLDQEANRSRRVYIGDFVEADTPGVDDLVAKSKNGSVQIGFEHEEFINPVKKLFGGLFK